MLIRTKRGKVERRKRKQNKTNIKKLPFIACKNDGRKEEVHRCHFQHKPLSYLHESQSKLYLKRNKNYIKRKIKTYTKKNENVD